MNYLPSNRAPVVVCIFCGVLFLLSGTALASDLPAFPTASSDEETEETEEVSDEEQDQAGEEDEEPESRDRPQTREEPEEPEEPAAAETAEEPEAPEQPQPEEDAEPDEPEEPEEQEEVRASQETAYTDAPRSGRAAEDSPRSTLLRRSVYDQGRWSLGIEGLFSRNSSRVELLEETEPATDTTRFMRVDPTVTVGVIDRLHVGLLLGFVSRRLAREGEESATETSYAIQPLIQYFLAVTPRLAGYLQGAAGYFRGGSERFVAGVDETGIPFGDVDTRTRGFVMSTGTGVSYRLSEGLQLRFGFKFNALWGRESADELEDRLSTATYNLGTTAGLRYTF